MFLRPTQRVAAYPYMLLGPRTALVQLVVPSEQWLYSRTRGGGYRNLQFLKSKTKKKQQEQVTKSFPNENKRMYGWSPLKPAKLDENDTTILHTIPTSCAILPTSYALHETCYMHAAIHTH